MIDMKAISKLLHILANLKSFKFHREDTSEHSKKLQDGFPGDKYIYFVVGAIARLSQETTGRVQLYHSNGLDVLFVTCLEKCAIGYLDPKKIASAALLNLIATHSLARKDCMCLENLERILQMLGDRNLYVVEMAVRMLHVLMKSTRWTMALYEHCVHVINRLVDSVKWAYEHLLDDAKMQEKMSSNEHDEDCFEDIISHIVNFGMATIWGISYKFSAFVENGPSRRQLLQDLDADAVLEYFAKAAMHEFGEEYDSSFQTSASGIVCMMSSFRSISHPEPAKFNYDEIYSVLLDVAEKADNMTVFINAICGVAQILDRTFQTPDEQHAIDAALKIKIWESLMEKLADKQSLLHENENCQVAVTTSLMYLSRHINILGQDELQVLTMLLDLEWLHVHAYCAACVWGLAQTPEVRHTMAGSDLLMNRLVDVLNGPPTEANLRSREWAAGAIFALIHDTLFSMKLLLSRVAVLINVLVEGTSLVKTIFPVGGNEHGNMNGDTERTIWNRKNENSSECTSSTLLFCVIGSLWMIVVNEDAALVLLDYPLAKSVTALALYTSQTSDKYPIKCPKLRRYAVGITHCLWGREEHRQVMQSNYREDVMEFLFVGLLSADDVSSQCDAAIGLSICAMEWNRKAVIAKLGAIKALVAILRDIPHSGDGNDLQYCVLHALLNLSQNRKIQVVICNRALDVLSDIVSNTKSEEIFCIVSAIIANIEKNRRNKQRFHKFRLSQTAQSVVLIERHFGGNGRLRGDGLPMLSPFGREQLPSSPLLRCTTAPLQLNGEMLDTSKENTSTTFFDITATDPMQHIPTSSPIKKHRPSTTDNSTRATSRRDFENRAQLSHADTRPWNTLPIDSFQTSMIKAAGEQKTLKVCHSMQSLRNSLTSQLKPSFATSPVSKMEAKITKTLSVPTRKKKKALVSMGTGFPQLTDAPLVVEQGGDYVGEEDRSLADDSFTESAWSHMFAGDTGKDSPRLRSGPSAIQDWALPSTWSPRVSTIDTISTTTTRVGIAASRVSTNSMRFGKDKKKKAENSDDDDDDSLIRLSKFKHTKGSKVYSKLFNTYESQDGGGECHFYQKSVCPYEAVLIPYPAPHLSQHGLGQLGYLWPETAMGFKGICKDGYPCASQTSLLNPDPNFMPRLFVPGAMQCPTPPHHSVDRSRSLFHMHRVFKTKHIEESDSPFFGMFPDEEKSLFIEIRDEYKAPIVVVEEYKAPYRGEGWQLENSIWTERVKESDAKDFWDNDKVYRKCFEKDWAQIINLTRVQKLIKRLDKGVRIENQGIEKEVEEMATVLRDNYKTILNVFRYYASLEGTKGPAFIMQANSFKQFCHDSKLTEGEKSEAFDQMFILVNFEEDKTTKESSANADKALERMEWLEIVIRCALLKHGDNFETDFSNCIQDFIDKTLPNLPDEVLQTESNHFRCNRLYNHKVDEMMKANHLVLRAIFHQYKGSTDAKRGESAKTMDMKDWNQMVKDLNLFQLGLSQREANIIFIKSIPLCVNEMTNVQKSQHLKSINFFEAVCRLADAIDIPDAEHMAELGVNNTISFHEKLLEAPMDVQKATAEKFAVFRACQFKEKLGEQHHLHSRLEEALSLIFWRMSEALQDSSQGYLFYNGNRMLPALNPPKEIKYLKEFDQTQDPPIFETQDIFEKKNAGKKKSKRRVSTAK
jgi:hypothetical protein